jgi:hypothetical protein
MLEVRAKRAPLINGLDDHQKEASWDSRMAYEGHEDACFARTLEKTSLDW